MTKPRTRQNPEDAAHWKALADRLPEEGVASLWGTEALCRERLAAVRWPDGGRCLRCESSDIGFMEMRKAYHCRKCRYQFTVLTGSILRSSKLSPQLWFEAAEEYIRWRAKHGSNNYGLHAFADTLGVAYPTAHRARKILESDLGPGGSGLLVRCICADVEVTPRFCR